MAGHDRITAQGRRFLAEIEQLRQLQVRIGYQQGEAFSEEGVDMVDIATWNEVGTVHSPARPFLRQSIDNNEAHMKEFCQEQLRQFAQGTIDARTLLNRIGLEQTALVQKEITDGTFAPNAQATIQKKGSDKPLIDTGRMYQSVHHVIRRKRG